VVGQRIEHEAVGARHERAQRAARKGQLVERHAADQPLGELARGQLHEPFAQRVRQRGPDVRGPDRAIDDLVAGGVVRQCLDEQVAEQVHGDAPLDQRVGEGVVLLPRALDP
jgi:hypothetical protein